MRFPIGVGCVNGVEKEKRISTVNDLSFGRRDMGIKIGRVSVACSKVSVSRD
jgi:hypothetical protein